MRNFKPIPPAQGIGLLFLFCVFMELRCICILQKVYISPFLILPMTAPLDIKSYYSLYCAIRGIPRFTIKQISSAINHDARGQKRSTVAGHVNNLYKRKISLRPNLVLRTFENCLIKGYFLKIRQSETITSAFHSLAQNEHLLYMLLLSGEYDFFVTSKSDLKFGKGLRIMKKSISFTPYYTFPQGWDSEVKDSLFKIAGSSLSKGKMEREIEDWLPWEPIHFKIYDIMKNNVQIPFARVGKETGYAQNTIKTYFYRDVLPYCDISHYFFPKGYDHYDQAFILAHSEYETGLQNAFSRLPCTTYFFPLEEEVAIILFHENISDLMFTIRKFEEKGYIKKYLLLIPLHWE